MINPVYKKEFTISALTFLLSFTLFTAQASAVSNIFSSKFLKRPSDLTQRKSIFITPFTKNRHEGLRLTNPTHDLDSIMTSIIRSNLIDPAISIKSRSQNKGLNLHGTSSKEYQFYIQDIKLCDFQLKATTTTSNNSPLILGEMPTVEVSDHFDLNDWPSLESSLANVQTTAFFESTIQSPLSITSKEKCFKIEEQELKPVWDLIVKGDKLLYHAVADGHKTYSFDPHFFDATSTAKVYKTNSKDGDFVNVELPNMSSTGQLENNYFYTEIDRSSLETRTSSSDNKFIYDPVTEKSQFEETSVFTNANRMVDWLKTVGYTSTDFGQNKIRLVVHANLNGDINNALYQPSSTGNPSIYMGDGDGRVLKNLPTDSDVIFHEFGHHVIFRSIKTTSGESLVLHEGLADFLAYAKTGNNCLGESICPIDSPLNCAVKAQCLRTAENSFIYGGATTPREPHLKSQFISGMLWDIHEDDGVPLFDLSKIVIKSIEYLTYNSGYRHLIVALIHADTDLYNGRYCMNIYKHASQRGLSGLISDFGCGDRAKTDPTLTEYPSMSNNLPDSIEKINPTPNTTPQNVSKKKSKGGGLCGIIGYGSSNYYFSLILYLLPTAIPFIRRRKY